MLSTTMLSFAIEISSIILGAHAGGLGACGKLLGGDCFITGTSFEAQRIYRTRVILLVSPAD